MESHTQNILSWKGPTRILKSNSQGNGPTQGPTLRAWQYQHHALTNTQTQDKINLFKVSMLDKTGQMETLLLNQSKQRREQGFWRIKLLLRAKYDQ